MFETEISGFWYVGLKNDRDTNKRQSIGEVTVKSDPGMKWNQQPIQQNPFIPSVLRVFDAIYLFFIIGVKFSCIQLYWFHPHHIVGNSHNDILLTSHLLVVIVISSALVIPSLNHHPRQHQSICCPRGAASTGWNKVSKVCTWGYIVGGGFVVVAIHGNG